MPANTNNERTAIASLTFIFPPDGIDVRICTAGYSQTVPSTARRPLCLEMQELSLAAAAKFPEGHAPDRDRLTPAHDFLVRRDDGTRVIYGLNIHVF
jgi:hypothetical protein